MGTECVNSFVTCITCAYGNMDSHRHRLDLKIGLLIPSNSIEALNITLGDAYPSSMFDDDLLGWTSHRTTLHSNRAEIDNTDDVLFASTFKWDLKMTSTDGWKGTHINLINIHNIPCLEVLTDYDTGNPRTSFYDHHITWDVLWN